MHSLGNMRQNPRFVPWNPAANSCMSCANSRSCTLPLHPARGDWFRCDRSLPVSLGKSDRLGTCIEVARYVSSLKPPWTKKQRSGRSANPSANWRFVKYTLPRAAFLRTGCTAPSHVGFVQPYYYFLRRSFRCTHSSYAAQLLTSTAQPKNGL